MDTDVELRAGDVCPIDGGEFVPDHEQDPETQIENKHLNSPNPAAAQRYEKQVRAKVEAEGVIHKCLRCGYRARFKTADAEASARKADDTAREGRDRQRDERDARAREEREAATRHDEHEDPADTTSSSRGAPAGTNARRASRPSGNG